MRKNRTHHAARTAITPKGGCGHLLRPSEGSVVNEMKEWEIESMMDEIWANPVVTTSLSYTWADGSGNPPLKIPSHPRRSTELWRVLFKPIPLVDGFVFRQPMGCGYLRRR
jgi:hypothetical protein